MDLRPERRAYDLLMTAPAAPCLAASVIFNEVSRRTLEDMFVVVGLGCWTWMLEVVLDV